jgi:hypothetical protein
MSKLPTREMAPALTSADAMLDELTGSPGPTAIDPKKIDHTINMTTVGIDVPMVREFEDYAPRNVYLKMSNEQAKILTSVQIALQVQGKSLKNGRKINGIRNAMLYLIENLAEK